MANDPAKQLRSIVHKNNVKQLGHKKAKEIQKQIKAEGGVGKTGPKAKRIHPNEWRKKRKVKVVTTGKAPSASKLRKKK